MQSAAKTP